ncbi:S8 family serine peptidase [Xanthobacter sp. VNH20]|uniref:S8 family serine peptidase n=1 Tax=Xanthobacter sp. VNH20 TaxID=3156616 RepID=UPI0032B328A5
MTKTYIPSDPLFALQWHLLNTGQNIFGLPQDPNAYHNDINVIPVWPDYTGEGVEVAVLDGGFQATHPDLAPNYLTDKSYSFLTSGAGLPQHGTATLGLVIAADNDIGGVGVAFGAKGIGYTFGSPGSTFIRAVNRILLDGADVMSNSWVWENNLASAATERSMFDGAMISLVQIGREGLGTVALFAAGNDRARGVDTNGTLSTSSPYAITVAAANVDGTVSSYSTPGASILVAAPGSGESSGSAKDLPSIVTTDLLGTAGYNKTANGDYTDLYGAGSVGFNGTSAATPIVAGVVALMLQANPKLGYRDVQEILAYSARTPQGVTTWSANGAADWNGGGHLYSNDLGFGEVNALAAVRLAETWTKQSTYDNMTTAKAQFLPDDDPFGINLTIAAGETKSYSVSFSDVMRVQHVLLTIELYVTSNNPTTGLDISLTGPGGSGPSSLLHASDTISGSTNHLVFDTVHNWGQISTAGEWTLTISNLGSSTLTIDAALDLLGDKPSAGQTFIYTDDYARLGGSEAGRTVLSAEGINAINAAAVTSDTSIDLSSHLAHIAGVYTTLDPASLFGTLITGDGNDSLVGDASDNLFISGRGINSIVGGGGVDTLQLLKGIADYSQVQWGNDILLAGSASNDAVQGIAKFVFADGTLTLGTNVLVNDVFYATANRDVLASGIDTDTHYDLYGWKEGRDPNAWFSTVSYLANHADVRAAHVNPLTYYNDVGWKNGDDPSAWFDTTLYLKLNPDVAAAGVDPLAHFLAYGEAEGREVRPVVDSSHLINGAFDPTFYKLANPDVALSGMDAFAHWLQYGMAEGRNPDAYFDTSFYLAHNPDVAAAGVDPLQHYLNYGWKEGRDPSSAFDTEGYLAAYADVKESGMDPLVHYLQFGIAEGRHATWDLA